MFSGLTSVTKILLEISFYSFFFNTKFHARWVDT